MKNILLFGILALSFSTSPFVYAQAKKSKAEQQRAQIAELFLLLPELDNANQKENLKRQMSLLAIAKNKYPKLKDTMRSISKGTSSKIETAMLEAEGAIKRNKFAEIDATADPSSCKSTLLRLAEKDVDLEKLEKSAKKKKVDLPRQTIVDNDPNHITKIATITSKKGSVKVYYNESRIVAFEVTEKNDSYFHRVNDSCKTESGIMITKEKGAANKEIYSYVNTKYCKNLPAIKAAFTKVETLKAKQEIPDRAGQTFEETCTAAAGQQKDRQRCYCEANNRDIYPIVENCDAKLGKAESALRTLLEKNDGTPIFNAQNLESQENFCKRFKTSMADGSRKKSKGAKKK